MHFRYFCIIIYYTFRTLPVMSHVWSDSDVHKVLKMRPCRQGYEYLIGWKNGERPTWELRDSFSKSTIFDKFDEEIRRKAAKQFPLFTYHQRAIRDPSNSFSITGLYEQGYKPKEITGCIEVYGKRFALMSYVDTEKQDFIRWSTAEDLFPELTSDFLEKRGLKER